MKTPFASLALCWVLSSLPQSAVAAAPQDWPHWRGPRYDGSSPAVGLPVTFGAERNVRWSADLPGAGAGTPVIVGDRVYVSSVEEAPDGDRTGEEDGPRGGRLIALCFDRATGALRWRADAGSGYRPGGGKGSATSLHGRSNYASPSPVADGERAFFLFGNGDLLAYDLDGERLWARNLQRDFGDFAFQWTFAASPTLYAGNLYLPVLQRDEPANGLGADGAESFLLALDPATGETRFRHVRPAPARMESLESYATPIPFVGADGRAELLLVGGDVLTGHDPATGTELWRWGTWNTDHREMWWRVVPSPVVGAGVVLACAPKGAPVFAVRTGGEGALGADALAWASSGRRNPVTSDVPTPAFDGARFYVLSDLAESLSRVHPGTGAVEWTTELPGKARWRGSPTVADGKVWCVNHAGLVVVVDAESGAVLAENDLAGEEEDQVRSSLAAAHGNLFLRTHRALYCFATDPDGE